MKRNVLPLPLDLIFLRFLAINCLLASIINKGYDVQYQIYGLHGEKYLPIFFQSAIFCAGLTMYRWGGSVIQSLYYCCLICVHMGRCISPLTWGTAPPSPHTFGGGVACSSWHCLRWEDCHPLRLLASTALSCWDFTSAIWKWNT